MKRAAMELKDPLPTMTKPDLITLCLFCDTHPAYLPLKVALTFGFFGLFRVSNLAPATVKEFDPCRHTRITDVIRTSWGLLI